MASGALTCRGLAATTRCRFTELNPTYLSGSEQLPIRRMVVNMEVNWYPEASLSAKENLNPRFCVLSTMVPFSLSFVLYF